MKIRKSFKYRIYPNKSQQNKLNQQFGASRFVYNYYLRQRIDYYAKNGSGLTYYKNAMDLVDLKNQPEYEWLKKSHSQVLQQSLTDLDNAYSNFFNKKSNFPKFKKKHGRQSCRFPQGFKLTENKLYIPKVGLVKIILHRQVEGKMKNLTVSKTKSGKYFVSIQVEQEIDDPHYTGNKIGLDLGIKDFVVTSESQKYSYPKFYRKSERQLKKLQKQFFRAKKGSKGREKIRVKLARCHEKIANQRKDFLHKLSRKLVNDNQLIVIEDLNIKGMIKNHHLAKSISDSSWSEFIRQLEYKGQWYGCQIEKIDRFFPSSKCCFYCGYINNSLKLSDRIWTCKECGSVLDRDVNAAKNILNWYTVGNTEIYADGQLIRPFSEG